MTKKEIIEKAKNNFYTKMNEYHKNIKLLSDYITATDKVKCKCLICGYEWDVTPNSLLRKDKPRGCPKCAKNIPINDSETRTRFYELYGTTYDIVSDNVSGNSKAIIMDNTTGEFFSVSNIGTWLKSKKQYHAHNMVTTKMYKNMLSNINSQLEPIEEYKGWDIKIKHLCKLHNEVAIIDPSHTIRGQGCSMCKLDKIGFAQRKKKDKYLDQLDSANPYVELDGDYISGNIKTRHRCKLCGYVWHPFPENLLSNKQGCPKCSSSKGEKEVRNILKKYNFYFLEQYRFEDCRNKKPLPFDFYLPDHNVCIEFQGRQHYHPSNFGGISDEIALINFKEGQIRDDIKRNFCKNSNIKLIEIKYDELDNVEKIILTLLKESEVLNGQLRNVV